MPEIKITERDITTGYVEEEDYVVFVPGNVSDKSESGHQFEYIGERTLFSDLKTFIKEIGAETPTYSNESTPFTKDGIAYDPGYLYARFLLGLGYKVYYAVPSGAKQEGVQISSEVVSDDPQFSMPYNPTGPEGQVLTPEERQQLFQEGLTTGIIDATTPQNDTQIYTNVKVNMVRRYSLPVYKSSNGGEDIAYNVSTQEQKTAW